MPKERNSNIELLRIVCILFVLVHHILYHGVGIYRGACESYPYLYSFVNQLCYVAVDVFFLISGYFAIRTNWKKLLWLYLMCGIVGGLGYAFNCVLTGHSVGKSILRYVLFGFSNSRGWYADVYLYLFLLAPFINVALQSMSKRMHHYLLGTLTVMSVYLGWFWGMGINATGFCLMQAVLMYSIGYYLRNFFDFSRVPRMAWGGGVAPGFAVQCAAGVVHSDEMESCVLAFRTGLRWVQLPADHYGSYWSLWYVPGGEVPKQGSECGSRLYVWRVSAAWERVRVPAPIRQLASDVYVLVWGCVGSGLVGVCSMCSHRFGDAIWCDQSCQQRSRVVGRKN